MAETPKDGKPVRPIIIIKKKGGHAGHHGGAWKVAYADFVTAMMALFIVLWLVNSNTKIQEAVAGYFQDPKGFEGKNSGMMGGNENFAVSKDDMPKLKEEISAALERMANFETLKNQVEIKVTAEGLRIELIENGKGMFFESANDVPTKSGDELLRLLAAEIGKLPNMVSIEGHTDSKPFAVNKWDYSNWELSADRANTARRIMQEHGLSPKQVSQIRGFADTRLRKPEKPLDDSNRRVSVIVQYLTWKAGEKPPPGAEPHEKGEGGEKAEGGEHGEGHKTAEAPHKPGHEEPAKAAEHKPEAKAPEAKPEAKAAEHKPEAKAAEHKPEAKAAEKHSGH